MRRLALLGVCLSVFAAAGYMSFWWYSRAQVQSWLDEAWRRAAEGEALVAAIDKYRDDHGAYPGDQLEGLSPSYVADIHPAWVLLPYEGETSLYFTFGIVEWTLEFNFSKRRWMLNGRPLDDWPQAMPWPMAVGVGLTRKRAAAEKSCGLRTPSRITPKAARDSGTNLLEYLA